MNYSHYKLFNKENIKPTLIICNDEHKGEGIHILAKKLEESQNRYSILYIYRNNVEQIMGRLEELSLLYSNLDVLELESELPTQMIPEKISTYTKGKKVFWLIGDESIRKLSKGVVSFGINKEENIATYLFNETEDITKVNLPKFIGITLTNKCNYKCFFCDRENNNKYNTIKLDNLYALKPLIKVAEIINITGWGEPLSFKYIKEAITFINKNNNKCCISLTTNASLLTEELAELLSKNLKQLIISINAATKTTYERDMKNGKWEKVLQNIKNARKYIPRDKMHLVFVGHKDNIHEFPHFVELAIELDVWMVELLHLQVTKIEHLKKSLWFYKEETNKYIKEAKALGDKFNIVVQARSFDSDYETKITRFNCTAPFDQAYILESGDVAPCCYAGNQVMGNINVFEGFINVWNNKKYKRLREEKYFPECSTCGNANNLNYLITHIHEHLKRGRKFFNVLPLVSVVVPSYNQAEWLGKTLDSIIDQTYPVWEAVVVDDGSTDNTWEIIQEYSKKDNRIRGIHKENGGISSALNMGIEVARGKYFCWLSSDDLFNPDKLELQVKQFEKLDDSYGIIFGQFDHIDAEDNIKELKQTKPFFDGLEFPQQLKYDMIDGCTVMLPMNVMRELNGFNEEFKHAQDTEFWFRLAAKGYKFFYLDKKLTKRRIHKNQGFTDFNLDCRYDGYWFVDFYLSEYSFRDFYKNVDFNNRSHIDIFILHFLDMVIDPFCHISHPLVNEKFWKWFFDGLLTLDKATRKYIVKSLLELLSISFEKNSNIDEKFKNVKVFSSVGRIKKDIPIFHYNERTLNFRKKIFNKLIELSSSLFHYPQNKYKTDNEFIDITKQKRANNKKLIEKYFEYGISEKNKGNLLNAQSVMKYLSDFDNHLIQRAFKNYVSLSFLHSDYEQFIKSFRRKNSIETFPDRTKAYYIYALQKLNKADEKINYLFNLINEENISEKVEKFISYKNTAEQITDINYINYWNYVVNDSKITHELKIKCPYCSGMIHKKFDFPISTVPSSEKFICIECLSEYEFSDSLMPSYFDKEVAITPKQNNNNPKVAFIMRYTNIIGGGVRVAIQHMSWLHSLGVDIIVYSDTDKPSWVVLPGKFIRVKDHYDIKKIDVDAVVVFSVYDVPKIKRIFDSRRIYHLCQGYEGYHLGKTYNELRSDKYFYDVLHSLKVNNIVVSEHLKDLFKNKFGRDSYYIPNNIDLSVFKPKPKVKPIPNSILFIGNPKDPLKGLNFLIKSLTILQSSAGAIENLKLFIVYGGNKLSGDEDIKSTSKLDIIIKRGLSPEQMSDLMNSVSVVVNTSWYEGFTLPILEAMACGTPTLSVDNMGVRSFAEDQKNSFIVKYGDYENFNKKLKEIFRRSNKINELIYNGLQTAKEYSAYNSVKNFLSVYSQILACKFADYRYEKLLNEYFVDTDKLDTLLEQKISLWGKANNNIILDKVSLIIVTYNQIDYTLKSIASIKRNTYVDYELIIVDNASSDDTVARLRNDKSIMLIQNRENLGFPKAVNMGIMEASGKYVLILNNDTIVTPGWLERMIEVAEADPKVGLVGPISNSVSGVQLDKNAKYNSIEEMHKYAEKISKENKGQVQQFPRVAFLCTLIKREVIDKIGGLDERFSPGNFEDDDFCLRAQLAGFKTVIAKDVFIHHYGSKSFKANGEAAYAERMQINQQKFIDKWGADPNEIWLKGKKIKKRGVVYPVNKSEFIEAFNRAIIHSEENELEFALKEAERAIENFESSDRSGYEKITKADVLNFTANIAFQLGDFEKAQDYFKSELELNPESGRACLGLAEVFYNAELYEEAKTMYEWAIRNGENKNGIWKKLADVNLKLGLDENNNSLELTESKKQYTLEDAEELINKSDLKGAAKILDQLLEDNPGNIDALNDYAVINIMQKDYEAALGNINKVIEIDPQNEIAIENLKYIEAQVTP